MSLFVLNKILLNNLFFHCITFFTRNTLMESLRPGEFVWTLEGKSQPYKISIADGATVTLSDATINGTSERVCKTSSGRYTSCDWAGLTCLGNCTIVLKTWGAEDDEVLGKDGAAAYGFAATATEDIEVGQFVKVGEGAYIRPFRKLNCIFFSMLRVHWSRTAYFAVFSQISGKSSGCTG